MTWVWSQGRGWIDYPGVDERPAAERLGDGGPIEDVFAQYTALVGDLANEIRRNAEDIEWALHDSARMNPDDLHDDELRRVLAEVLEELRDTRRALSDLMTDAATLTEHAEEAFGPVAVRLAEAS